MNPVRNKTRTLYLSLFNVVADRLGLHSLYSHFPRVPMISYGMKIGKIASLLLFSVLILSAVFAFAPVASAAEPISRIIPCTGADCNFCSFVNGMNNIIKYLIFTLAMPIGAITLAYAGFLYATAQGNKGKVDQAHEMFTKTGMGLFFALAAWIIVNFIFHQLVRAEYSAPWNSINCSSSGTTVIKSS